MDFFTAVGLASSTITIAEQQSKIKAKLQKITSYILNGSCNIIIFGAGGTGKTSLSHLISDNQLKDFKYIETPTTEKVSIKRVFGTYLVAPGQKIRVQRYWPELFRELGAGKISGVINVVSYGFHSINIGNKSHKSTSYYDEEKSDTFLNDYITLKRNEEIEYLKLISEHVKTTENKFWMITLVNKQDLWWDEKEKVEEHYKGGEYNELIEDIVSMKGKNNFIHEYISGALINHNFNIGNDFLKETIQGYDEPIRLSNYNNFLIILNSLIDNGFK